MNNNLRIDRRGIAIATIAGASYLVLGAAWPLALGVFVLVYVLNEIFTRPTWRMTMPTPAPAAGTPEAGWLERAEFAAASIDRLRRTARSTAVAHRCEAIAIQARLSVAALRRLTYQAGVVSGITRSPEIEELRENERRLRIQQRELAGPQRDDLDHTIASLVARREGAERLELTRRDLQQRIEASALALEGVVARVAEIVALTDDNSRATPLDDLVDELDTLRIALVETDDPAPRPDHALMSNEEEGR
jgi:hypothetical protein